MTRYRCVREIGQKHKLTMKPFWHFFVFQLSCSLVNCQHLEWNGTEISNNSVIYYAKILTGSTTLMCQSDNSNCCSSNATGNWTWKDETGGMVHQGADGARCLYFTRGDLVVSLHRIDSNGVPPASGLWRCDIPDTKGELQSLFIFIGTSISSG